MYTKVKVLPEVQFNEWLSKKDEPVNPTEMEK